HGTEGWRSARPDRDRERQSSVTSRAVVALVASAGLSVAIGGGRSALAVHLTTDVPLSIASEDVQRYREDGEDVVVIDLRPGEATRQGLLPRARSVPLAERRRRESEIPRSARVVLYAGTTEEAAA